EARLEERLELAEVRGRLVLLFLFLLLLDQLLKAAEVRLQMPGWFGNCGGFLGRQEVQQREGRGVDVFQQAKDRPAERGGSNVCRTPGQRRRVGRCHAGQAEQVHQGEVIEVRRA